MSADVRTISAIALEGIPEIGLRDDLATLIGDAIERTPGTLPLRDDDILVVTQKVVSKAEGAIIDLDGVTPSPAALEFGRRRSIATRARCRSSSTRRCASCGWSAAC